MKRSFYIIITLLIAAFVVTSCSLESDTVAGDGDMEGMWHLENITVAPADSAGHDSVNDLSNRRIFWSFQHKLLQLKDFDSNATPLLCRFDIADGKLSLHDFYVNVRAHDTLTVDPSKLAPYYIDSATPTYDYTIDGGRLTLRKGRTTMSFKRF